MLLLQLSALTTYVRPRSNPAGLPTAKHHQQTLNSSMTRGGLSQEGSPLPGGRSLTGRTRHDALLKPKEPRKPWALLSVHIMSISFFLFFLSLRVRTSFYIVKTKGKPRLTLLNCSGVYPFQYSINARKNYLNFAQFMFILHEYKFHHSYSLVVVITSLHNVLGLNYTVVKLVKIQTKIAWNY